MLGGPVERAEAVPAAAEVVALGVEAEAPVRVRLAAARDGAARALVRVVRGDVVPNE